MFRTPSPFARRLALESLESRLQMAGMVELALDGGNWTFTGDGAANGIEIELVAQGEYFVRGLNQGGEATKIKIAGFDNLVATEFHVFSDLTYLTANLNAGDDRLRIVGRGPGNDALRIGNSLVANLADGDDTVELKYVSLPNFSLDLGAGNDEVRMFGISSLYYWGWYNAFRSITTGTGKDRVEIEDSRFRSIRIDTGADADAVLLEEVTATVADVLTGAGEDELAIVGGEFASRLSIDTGADRDQAALFAVSADEIYAQMGDGDDTLNLIANSARAAKFLGGGGKDVLNFDPFIGINNEFETLGTDGFETVT
jgi:hypothetical protein